MFSRQIYHGKSIFFFEYLYIDYRSRNTRLKEMLSYLTKQVLNTNYLNKKWQITDINATNVYKSTIDI